MNLRNEKRIYSATRMLYSPVVVFLSFFYFLPFTYLVLELSREYIFDKQFGMVTCWQCLLYAWVSV